MKQRHKAQELCESRGGGPGPETCVPNSPYGLSSRKATSKKKYGARRQRERERERERVFFGPKVSSCLLKINV